MIIVMNITTRLVIAIKWIGVVLGGLAYILAFFIFKDGPEFLYLMPFSFLVWFVPTWLIGWVAKGYTSIIPYPYPMKKDGRNYYEESLGWLFIFLFMPSVGAGVAYVLYTIFQFIQRDLSLF